MIILKLLNSYALNFQTPNLKISLPPYKYFRCQKHPQGISRYKNNSQIEITTAIKSPLNFYAPPIKEKAVNGNNIPPLNVRNEEHIPFLFSGVLLCAL